VVAICQAQVDKWRPRTYDRPVVEPRTEIDARFGEPGVEPVAWQAGREALERAELYWVSTVRTDGRPHVTPLIAVWLQGAMYFCTGPEEQKAINLAANPSCALTTGSNALHGGFDLVVEGRAERVSDDAKLGPIAAAYLEKYGEEWRFEVREGGFQQAGSEGLALVFELAPAKVLGFGKDPYSQTRWLFD
jgi:nitroimidazol reductase NimA-like FMN-containing flavoprotein (pyridoxamine 5'-phosphate oxidase superfamily)